jgi:hypothetical protein
VYRFYDKALWQLTPAVSPVSSINSRAAARSIVSPQRIQQSQAALCEN